MFPQYSCSNVPHSNPQDLNRINSIHNGPAPSIKTNSSSPTPQPDDQLLKKQTINYIHHQKYPSDASSIIGKRGPTPSTTASSSPAPAAMKAMYEQRMQAESGRGSSISSSVAQMDQLCNMPHVQCHDQQQQQGNGGDIVENQQSSQTESENVHMQMQNESCSYQQHHQYNDSHPSLTNSQSGSIPLYRVGTFTSNTSMPTCSSTQGSQPSLVNGSGLFHHYPTPHHHAYQSYGMPGSVTGGRAEVGIICDDQKAIYHLETESDLVTGSQKSPTFIIV